MYLCRFKLDKSICISSTDHKIDQKNCLGMTRVNRNTYSTWLKWRKSTYVCVEQILLIVPFTDPEFSPTFELSFMYGLDSTSFTNYFVLLKSNIYYIHL